MIKFVRKTTMNQAISRHPALSGDTKQIVPWMVGSVNDIFEGKGMSISADIRHDVNLEEGEIAVTICWGAEKDAPKITGDRHIGYNVATKLEDLNPTKVAEIYGTATLELTTLRKPRKIIFDVPALAFEGAVGFGIRRALLRAGEFKTNRGTYRGPREVRLHFDPEANLGEKAANLREGDEQGRVLNVMRWLAGLPTNVFNCDTAAGLIDELFAGRDGCTVSEPTDEQYAMMGGLQAVGRGRKRPDGSMRPRVKFIRIDPLPENKNSDNLVVFTGKNLVFDSGGLCLKPKGGIGMKGDCGAGCGVIALAERVLWNRAMLRQPVLLAICIAENSIGPEAYRPGDILQMYSGKTVEVKNTDAEGRLVLADGTACACDGEVDILVMFATMTGSSSHALGDESAALHVRGVVESNAFVRQLLASGEATCDPMGWLAAKPGFGEALASHIADMANIALESKKGGSQVAAAFMFKHVPDRVKQVVFIDGANVSGIDEVGKPWAAKGLPQGWGISLGYHLLMNRDID